VSQRGGAPGTRETDLLKPENMVQIVNAITLSGGSAYGLAAASGVMQCLESQGVGFPVPGGVVPIVPTAILFDPGRCGAPFNSRPNFSFGLNACSAARSGPVQEGNVGAGAGAVSGGVKGGLGTASVVLDKGVIVGAIVAVNSVGSTFDAAGTRRGVRQSHSDPERAAARHVQAGRGARRSPQEHDDRRRGDERGADEDPGDEDRPDGG